MRAERQRNETQPPAICVLHSVQHSSATSPLELRRTPHEFRCVHLHSRERRPELRESGNTNADVVLLTESAAFDPDIVAKIKAQLVAGKSVVITSGLLHALQGKGIEDIVEVRYTDRKILARKYLDDFGAGNCNLLGPEDNDGILFPDIRFLTNDVWPILRALASGKGYPLMLTDRNVKGVLYIWTIPDNFHDLYRLPGEVTSAIKRYVMSGFPVRLDGPARVALFACDNDTFIVESYLHEETDVKVSLLGGVKQLRNLVTGDLLNAEAARNFGGRRGRQRNEEQQATFSVHLLPHSYAVFAAEK
jgi:hypothetical protein